jgi:hypothetical protein
MPQGRARPRFGIFAYVGCDSVKPVTPFASLATFASSLLGAASALVLLVALLPPIALLAHLPPPSDDGNGQDFPAHEA